MSQTGVKMSQKSTFKWQKSQDCVNKIQKCEFRWQNVTN